MAQARSAGGAPDPDRITTRPQLAAALATVKGDRSYSRLLVASERLIANASVRQVGTDVGRGWRAERLTRGSVSDWLSDRSLPGRNKLVTFLAVCGVPAEEWRSWIEAVSRARQAAPGRTITDHDPLLLGVHPAIHAASDGTNDGGDLDVLTPYVIRDHDQKLRAQLRDGRGHQMVVLVGGSSVGKTRACFEAVREVLPGWPVVHPATAEELLAVLDGVAGTVLWLNETQRFLQPPHGRDVAIALQRVLTSPAKTAVGRVMILGSMWLDPYWQTFTRQPQHSEPDTHAEVRDLLTQLGVRINVAEDFSRITSEQLADLNLRAKQDPRLATAVAVGGERLRITQTLAGGPPLLGHYADLAGTPAHAVLTAAMDARRVGYESPLTATLLGQAAPGYLTPAQRAATAGWLPAALKVAAHKIHGIRALTPIRTDETIDEADGYLLHDFLVQHAISDRRREPIPTSLWEAVTRCVTKEDDLGRVGENAYNRGLVRYAVPVYRILAADSEGRDHAALRLAELLRDRSDETALAELRTRADAGDSFAAIQVAQLLEEQGNQIGAAEMWRAAAAHVDDDKIQISRLLLLMAIRDDEVAIAELRAGNKEAAEELDQLLWVLQNVRQDPVGVLIRTDVRGGITALHVSQWLAALAVIHGGGEYADELLQALGERPDDSGEAVRRLNQLIRIRGDEPALAELRAQADAGNKDSEFRLTQLLAKWCSFQASADDWDTAFQLAKQGDQAAQATLRALADAGDWHAAFRLAQLLAEQGDGASLRRELYAGNAPHASRMLINLYAAGNPERRRELQRYGLTADGHPAPAW